VAAVADERADRRAVRAPRLQHDDLSVEQAVLAPAVDDLPVGAALAAVDREVDLARPPSDGCRLEPLRRLRCTGDDALREEARVLVDAPVRLDREQAAPREERRRRGRRAVRVVPVEQDAGGIGAGRRGDARAQLVRLRVADPERVDAAQHDPRPALLEHEGRRLERQPRTGRALLRAHEPDHRQADGRRDRDRGRAGSQPDRLAFS
jgi:hypothetical protein